MLRWTLTAGIAALAAVLIGAGPALAAGWTVAPPPPTGQDAYINSIAARTDTDAWAVGSVGQQSSTKPSLPLIDHWNGTAWSQATPPSFPATNGVHLGRVSSRSAADAWAVGTINLVKHPGYSSPLTVHWDGSTCTNVPVAASQPGYRRSRRGRYQFHERVCNRERRLSIRLVEHWDGTAWTRPAAQSAVPHAQRDHVRPEHGRRDLRHLGKQRVDRRDLPANRLRQHMGPVLSALGRHRVEPRHDAAGHRCRLDSG